MNSSSVPVDFESAHRRACELCDYFDARLAEIMAPGYKEDAARNEFITPFFEALGWDVRNTAHRSVYEKDVVTEKREDIAGTARSADYAFRRPGTHLTAFFVEAKKPSVDIRTHSACYQAVLYGWNANVPLVVLTDFEQLLILDSRSEPHLETATRHILKANGSYTYKDYRDSEKFTELWGLLARENVAAGSFDKAAAALPKLSGRIHKDDLFARGSGPVDETFLAQMEVWREKLARSLKRSNHYLDGERLTSLTQRILDRLVFLRFLEDRGIEREVTFASIGKGGSAWGDFLKVSRRLDARYNGIIYKKDVDGCEDPALDVDDGVFAAIAEKFAPQNSKYLFASISVTILGSIYERFLGNVIVSREKTAVVEPKPEVRKAGGVYYTPDYIVRYIVEQTVGRCIAGKKPAEIEKLRFADIACGSGSFLVEVFACLIRYQLAWYLEDGAETWAKKGVLRQRELDGDYVLALAEKRRLLLANVYGVDLDPQAVEVTQLSLYLKLMEDESFPSTQSLFDFEKHALLPNLQEHIQRGNSLIEPDVSDLFGLSSEQEERIYPIRFHDRFRKVFTRTGGGFDAIVGNPPYVLLQDGFRDPLVNEYVRRRYAIASYKLDTYHLFFERALSLLKDNGFAGYITPTNFLTNNHLDKLRRFLLTSAQIETIITFDGQVFEGASVDTAISLFRRSISSQAFVLSVARAGDPTIHFVRRDLLEPQKCLLDKHALITPSMAGGNGLIERMERVSKPLSELADVNFGKQLRDRAKFPNDVISVSDEKAIPNMYIACVTGKDVRRYMLQWGKLACLKSREAQSGGCWDEKKHGTRPKLLTRQIGKQPVFACDDIGYHCLNTIFMVTSTDKHYSIKYILGLLNSRLLAYFWKQRFFDQRQTFPKIKGTYLKRLPIREINFASEIETRFHSGIINLVDKLITATKAEATAHGSGKTEYWRQTVAALDRQIDSVVYELYGLTDEEISLVEGDQ